jgi:hypothetical protein
VASPSSYTMPKLLIDSAGDQFFLPDSSRFYFDKLPGEKYLRYEPNSDHSLQGNDLRASLTAFYQSVLNGSKRPGFQWTFDHNDAIRMTTKREAHNCQAVASDESEPSGLSIGIRGPNSIAAVCWNRRILACMLEASRNLKKAGRHSSSS